MHNAMYPPLYIKQNSFIALKIPFELPHSILFMDHKIIPYL